MYKTSLGCVQSGPQELVFESQKYSYKARKSQNSTSSTVSAGTKYLGVIHDPLCEI